ncbi:39S ribosomal protein L54, mitochondrial [Aethina tumida]|uniref:39S ribosomal protein L54, mitochondrial n=1 Tax=Aethina tumida TaxID=116153 RepID=UPI00096B4F2A|nr:39S ribosomal protein L54, mitochondrial [Aethina tumida]
MSTNSALSLLNIRTQLLRITQITTQKCNYAKKESAGVSMIGGALKKKKLGKLGPVVEKKVLPVETDANKLVNFACGTNIFKTGEDIQLKPDSEYPEWLWNIRTGDPKPLEELDPNSKEYWRRIRKMAMRRNNKLAQLKMF